MDARKEQLCDAIRECTCAVFKVCCEKEEQFPEYLKGIGRDDDSEFYRMVIGVVNDEAKKMFVNISNEWNGKDPQLENYDFLANHKLEAMKWILESLLDKGVAEELMHGIVHSDVVPKYAYGLHAYHKRCGNYAYYVPDLSEVVLKMYKEVSARRLLLRSPTQLALLENWNYQQYPPWNEFEEVAAELVLTLPS